MEHLGEIGELVILDNQYIIDYLKDRLNSCISNPCISNPCYEIPLFGEQYYIEKRRELRENNINILLSK